MRARNRNAMLGLVLCLLGAVLAGCGTANATSAGPIGSAPTALPVTGDLVTRCGDSTGDATGIDVTDVAMVSQDDFVIVEYSFTAPVSTLGALILTVEAHSQDGAAQGQLGVQVLDGKPVASFVVTSPTSEPTRQFDNVHVEGREVHAAFPAESIRALGSKWIWFAMVGGVNSVDDYCPGTAKTSPDNIIPIAVG